MAEYKVVDAEQLEAELTNLANKIREKGGTTEELDFYKGDFTNAVGAIESGGGEDTLRALLTNTLTEYTILDEFSLGGVRLSRNNLVKFVAPNLTGVDNYTFYLCGSLKYMDLGKISTFASRIVNGLHRLQTIILRKSDAIVPLTTPIENSNSILKEDYVQNNVHYYCYFYVPKALIEEYKVATNWSNHANRFRAIEDYPEITGGVI